MSIKDDLANSTFKIELTRDELAAVVHTVASEQYILDNLPCDSKESITVKHKYKIEPGVAQQKTKAFKSIADKIEVALQAEIARLNK